MKSLYLFICLATYFNFYCQTDDQEDINSIKNVLEMKRLAWSNNDIDAFMDGYWKNDSLKFYGSNGITYSWKNTLERYKKTYPTKAHTGTLKFKINSITKIQEASYYVMGEYFLKREAGEAQGVFMIVLKKIDGEWKIVADTSC